MTIFMFFLFQPIIFSPSFVACRVDYHVNVRRLQLCNFRFILQSPFRNGRWGSILQLQPLLQALCIGLDVRCVNPVPLQQQNQLVLLEGFGGGYSCSEAPLRQCPCALFPLVVSSLSSTHLISVSRCCFSLLEPSQSRHLAVDWPIKPSSIFLRIELSQTSVPCFKPISLAMALTLLLAPEN